MRQYYPRHARIIPAPRLPNGSMPVALPCHTALPRGNVVSLWGRAESLDAEFRARLAPGAHALAAVGTAGAAAGLAITLYRLARDCFELADDLLELVERAEGKR